MSNTRGQVEKSGRLQPAPIRRAGTRSLRPSGTPHDQPLWRMRIGLYASTIGLAVQQEQQPGPQPCSHARSLSGAWRRSLSAAHCWPYALLRQRHSTPAPTRPRCITNEPTATMPAGARIFGTRQAAVAAGPRQAGINPCPQPARAAGADPDQQNKSRKGDDRRGR